MRFDLLSKYALEKLKKHNWGATPTRLEKANNIYRSLISKGCSENVMALNILHNFYGIDLKPKRNLFYNSTSEWNLDILFEPTYWNYSVYKNDFERAELFLAQKLFPIGVCDEYYHFYAYPKKEKCISLWAVL